MCALILKIGATLFYVLFLPFFGGPPFFGVPMGPPVYFVLLSGAPFVYFVLLSVAPFVPLCFENALFSR